MKRWIIPAAFVGLFALTGCPSDENNTVGDAGTNGADDMATGTDMGNEDTGVEPTLLYIAKVQSTTTGAEGCAVEDPGPDIFGIGLEDGLGAPLGWGRPVWDAVTTEGNSHSDTSILDGSALDFGADACPDMFDGNVVSLGCDDPGSWIAFEFIDADEQRVALDATADQFIRVYEWGGQCTTGSLDDTYDLTICTDTAAITSGDDSSCTIQLLVGGAGEQPAEVAGF